MTAGAVSAVDVAVPGRPYTVHVGDGILGRLHELVPWPAHATRAVVVTQAPVAALYADQVAGLIERAGLAVTVVAVPDGEQAKTLATLEGLYHRFAGLPLRRDDVVVTLGGGVVGDLAGFAAATWNRGVALVHLPTTLLAQVDAAVGGKTAVNLPEGKNLVGAFHQPLSVVADVATLATLPQRERRAGLGEVAKYGFIADPRVLQLLEERPGSAVAGDAAVLLDLVTRSVRVKAAIVAADEREAGRRAWLNYGHTVGHAIEALTSYERYLHGEAVGLGMIAAARLAERLEVCPVGLAERTRAALDGLGLPTGGVRLDPRAVWEVMRRDKKARAGVRFVLCRTPGEVFLADEPPRPVVDDVLRSLA